MTDGPTLANMAYLGLRAGWQKVWPDDPADANNSSRSNRK